MKKVLNYLVIIILLIILVMLSYVRLIKKEKIISVFGYRFFIVLTGSMEPEIPKGSFIIIKNCPEYKRRRNC